MKILNPTNKMIEGMYNSKIQKFEPKGMVEIWDDDVSYFFLKKFGYKGLVHLEYNELMQKKYSKYKDFYRGQVLNGLEALLKWKRECMQNEEQAYRSHKAEKSSLSDGNSINVERFKEEINEILALMAEYKKEWEAEDKKKSKKAGAVSAKDATVRDTNETKAAS